MPNIPITPIPPAPSAAPKPSAPPAREPWRPSWLMAAPHRLGFFLAMLVLVAASGWWLLEQVGRQWGALHLGAAVSPTLGHAAVMVFGFMPLFFAGFLFTAGPRWLSVAPHTPQKTAPCMALQAAGWLLWLAGVHCAAWLAVAGAVLAALGLAQMAWLFWRLIAASQAEDQVHARTVGVGLVIGALCAAALAAALAADEVLLALAITRMALWAFITVVYVAVAHRMIPFFTSNVLPMIEKWRPFWVLWLMLGMVAFEVLALLVRHVAPQPPATWLAVQASADLALGVALLWLARRWGVVQSMKIRLLAMLHVGFVWLGLALLYSGVSCAVELVAGAPLLGLGAVHALGMGFLGSVMLAMVTRVSCGHSGRTLAADNFVWWLFWAFQGVVVLRLVAAVQDAPQWVTLLVALLWTLAMLAWSLRYGNWYGRPRADGKPG